MIIELLPQFCIDFAEYIGCNGGIALLVGGSIRDGLLKICPREFDIEVFGIEANRLIPLIAYKFGEVVFVGKNFGVFRLKEFPFVDISIPRKETKTGDLHTDFAVKFDVNLPFNEAAQRRDFTINSMGYDILANKLHDPFDGFGDLSNKILRHTSEKFSEDALRVLRGMQFISRFNLVADSTTIELCKGLSPKNLSKERIFDEFEKMLKLGKYPSKGFKFLVDTNWINHFPDFFAIYDSNLFDEFLQELDLLAEKRKCWPDGMLLIGKIMKRLGINVKNFYQNFCYKTKLNKTWLKQL